MTRIPQLVTANGILAAAVAVLAPSAVLAQSDLPRCSDDMPVIAMENAFLDPEGYPLQEPNAMRTLDVTTTEPCLDRYVFITDNGPVVAPDAQIVYSGRWEQIGRRRVARGGQAEEFSYSAGMAVSEEIAHEISASLSVGSTAAVKPLGVGFELTVEASVGYALSLASGTEESQDWEHSVTVEGGEEVIIWARRLHVSVQWTPRETYEMSDLFGAPLRFLNETYLPSQVQTFMASPEISETAALAIVEPMRLGFEYDNPPTTSNGIRSHAAVIGLLSDFLETHDGTLVSEYELPMRETYTVRYTY